MRGSLKQRSKGSWSIILDLGYEIDPATGRQKRQQRWHTVHGTRKQAEDKLADLLKEVKDGQYVDASTLTLGAWLREWFAASKSKWAAGTVERYRGIIERDLATSTIGQMLIQKLRDTHLEAYYAASSLAAPTLVVHHSILQQAIRKATKSKIISVNIAADLDHKPRLHRGRRDARPDALLDGHRSPSLSRGGANSRQSSRSFLHARARFWRP